MGFAPIQPTDLFDAAGSLLGTNPTPATGFRVDAVPSATGLGTRTGSLRSEISGTTTRKLIHWLVPEGPIVQMYCNPQSIRQNYNKDIQHQRTKGGFVIQYWGEALTTLDIEGTTGTSGIEGINVLQDIYRNEQVAFEPFALFQAAKNQQDTNAGDIFGIGSALSSGDSFLGALTGASEESAPAAAKQGPTLASLATQVEMYWAGEAFRGYFNSFTITERADNLGLFDYSIKFTVTQRRGLRRNFLGWHRSATSGPSNSSSYAGTPHSYGSLIEGSPGPTQSFPQPKTINPFESLANEIASIF
jgi:hypothetical protein